MPCSVKNDNLFQTHFLSVSFTQKLIQNFSHYCLEKNPPAAICVPVTWRFKYFQLLSFHSGFKIILVIYISSHVFAVDLEQCKNTFSAIANILI